MPSKPLKIFGIGCAVFLILIIGIVVFLINIVENPAYAPKPKTISTVKVSPPSTATKPTSRVAKASTKIDSDASTAASRLATTDAGQFVASSNAKHHQYLAQTNVASKGIGLSYDQVTHLLAEKFNFQDGVPVNGRRNSGGQDGYKGPAIQVIGDHENIWEAGIAIQEPHNVAPEIAMANAGSLMLFMKNVAPHWDNSIRWLEIAAKQAEDNPGTKISTTDHGIKYTVLYLDTTSATILTAKRAENPTDDILDAIKPTTKLVP